MRAAIFTDNDFDKVNGVTTTLKAVLKHAPPGVEARVYTAADLGVQADDYFVARSVGIGLPYYREMRIYWPRPRVLARELRAHGVDVIHVTTPGPVGLTARWLSRQLDVPMVGSYHTHLGEYAAVLSGSPRLGRLTERYLRWLYEPCDPLLVPSMATRSLLAGYGYRTGRCRLWPRGVDAAVFAPERRSQALRDAWHVDHRRPAVLYAGRLSTEKGLDIAAEVQRALESARIAHRLIFVGDGPMMAELRELCPDAVFLGTVPHDRVAVAMASADVFLFPSATDTFGNVVLEAQACGLPVLVTDRGGPCQQIVDGVTGYVCPAGGVREFAGRLALLLRNLEHRAEMGAAARDHARRRDWSSALAPVYGAWTTALQRSEGALDAVPAHH
jgi:glycosyltransferase involved in cell wall biosynthesis